MQRAWLTAALCFGVAGAASAQQDTTTVLPLGEIVVHAARAVATTGGASGLEVVIDSMMTTAAPTIEDVLRRTPLVQVRSNSRGEAQFSLRGSGSDARQVAVLMDGIPINLGWDHRTDLSILPAGAATSVTIARGLPSLLFGPNVLGGVVEIGVSAPAGSEQRHAAFDAALDHTGARNFAVRGTLPVARNEGGLVFRAGAAFRDREGFALPGSVTDPNAGDDLRSNSDQQLASGFASARYETNRGAFVSANVLGFQGERGIPAELHTSGPRYWRYPDSARLLTIVNAGTGSRNSPFGGSGNVQLSIGGDLGRTTIDQYDSPTYTGSRDIEESDDRNITTRLRIDQSVGGSATVQAGFTYADINHDEVLTPGESATYRQRLWSAAIEASTRARNLFQGTVLSFGIALDGADTPESGNKPALEDLKQWGGRVGVHSVVSDRWVVHGGASMRARFPALRELYSGALGRFIPNPELVPERLTAIEAGASLVAARSQLQVVGFHHGLSDAIVRISEDGKFKRVNRDSQSGSGVEILASTSLARVALTGDLVLQRTTEAEYQPGVLAGLGAAVLLPYALNVEAAARHTGSQQCINPETDGFVDLPSANRLDARVSRMWQMRRDASSVTVSAAVDNATDGLQYDQCGLPQPGRTFRLQVSVRY